MFGLRTIKSINRRESERLKRQKATPPSQNDNIEIKDREIAELKRRLKDRRKELAKKNVRIGQLKEGIKFAVRQLRNEDGTFDAVRRLKNVLRD